MYLIKRSLIQGSHSRLTSLPFFNTNQTPASLGPRLNNTEHLFDPFFSTPNRTIAK